MPFNINEMRSGLEYGGARPSLFQIIVTNPIDGVADLKMPIMAKAASLPASNLGTIEVPYFGRMIKIRGDRTFEDWTVTVINDEDFVVRNSLESWMNAINNHEANLQTTGSPSPASYKSQAQITQFAKTGNPIRVYNFNGIWPSSLSTIDMSWETNNTIEEFTVTFQYDWFDVRGATGNPTS